MWRVCRAMLGPTDAEDAWAETFLAALRAYPNLTPDSNVRGWLVTIAHRKALDQIRAIRRRPEPRPELSGDSHAPAGVASSLAHSRSDQPLDQLDDDELAARVAALPDKARLAVIYRYLADMSYPQVAALLGVSQAAARRNAADGIAKLRQQTSAAPSPTTRPSPTRPSPTRTGEPR